jgi:hypothetical protein
MRVLTAWADYPREPLPAPDPGGIFSTWDAKMQFQPTPNFEGMASGSLRPTDSSDSAEVHLFANNRFAPILVQYPGFKFLHRNPRQTF